VKPYLRKEPRRALLSFAVGDEYGELLQIARPSFEAFGEAHGYSVLTFTGSGSALERPPSWWKIPLIGSALRTYDEVLYLDADCVITDTSEDLGVPPRFWHAMVAHRTADGEVPNCGVWLLRREMRTWLARAWEMTQYTNHGWWEQAAIVELLGYGGRPLRAYRSPSALIGHTYWLDNGWNVHPRDTWGHETPRIMHATMLPDRAASMREWATQTATERGGAYVRG